MTRPSDPAAPAVAAAATTRHSAVDIARALGLAYPPTAEQQAIIEAPPGPMVVLAGAGSGKTDTMAARVVWLVANGFVEADQVLGLTFTRRAAAELRHRVGSRLRRLADLGWLPDEPGEAVVLTYDAFSNRVAAEFGPLLGVPGQAQQLSETMSRLRATRLVESWPTPPVGESEGVSELAAEVIGLADDLLLHGVDAERVRRFTVERAQVLMSTPPTKRNGAVPIADVGKVIQRMDRRLALLEIAERYRADLVADELRTFTDVAALAARIAEQSPPAVAALRRRFPVVLLDEYQDTSAIQLRLMAALFARGHAVTAVGDPAQAIYGWRGASANTLADFVTRFRDTSGAPAAIHRLSVSFRNDGRILQVANAIAAPLHSGRAVDTGDPLDAGDPLDSGVAAVTPPVLQPRRGAERDGCIESRWFEAPDDELRALAARIADYRDEHPGASVAVLFRRRARGHAVARSLAAAGLPVHVVSNAGLLLEPPVVFLRSLLAAVSDPRGPLPLLHLLTVGPWAVPAEVIDAAGALWRRLANRRPLSFPAALEHPAGREWLATLPSPVAARLVDLGGALRDLAAAVPATPDHIAAAAVRRCGIRAELVARGDTTGVRDVEAFLAAVEGVLEEAPTMTLGDLLSYLDAAVEHDRGLPRSDAGPVDPGAVVLTTVHSSKGLEWDAVFLVGMEAGTFPGKPRTTRGWLHNARELPYPLRADRGQLPEWHIDDCATQGALKKSIDAFADDIRAAAAAEERRLAYVAVTRARHLLWLSGAQQPATGASMREPSCYLDEVAQALGEAPPVLETAVAVTSDAGVARDVAVGAGAAANAAGAADPGSTVEVEAPTGDTAADLDDDPVVVAARAVRAALAEAAAAAAASAEQHAAQATASPVATPPDRTPDPIDPRTIVAAPGRAVSPSLIVSAARDPWRTVRRRRRPVPMQASAVADAGVVFHAWVEQHFASLDMLDLGGADATEPLVERLDADTRREVERWQANFLASRWAGQEPLAVEQEFHLPLAGRVVRGRIDAVFRRTIEGARGRRTGLTVIDWKTGRPARDPREHRARRLQLAVYRIAAAELHRVPLAAVEAGFYYAADDTTVIESNLPDRRRIVALLDTRVTEPLTATTPTTPRRRRPASGAAARARRGRSTPNGGAE